MAMAVSCPPNNRFSAFLDSCLVLSAVANSLHRDGVSLRCSFRETPAGSEAVMWSTSCRRCVYLIGGGLVQCSCATASVHADPSGRNISQVSASLPASIR